MKYLPLIFAGLWRRPARTLFTFLSITVAFILFGILAAIDGGLAHQLEAARLDRLIVDTKFGTQLPLAYLDRIARIPGVTVVAPRQILVGYYQDPKVPFGIIMTDRRFFDVRPELTATREQIDALLKTRTGALITEFSAKRFGWKVGQKVPVISNTVRQGNHTWTFDIVGIIDDRDRPGKARYFISNYEYMDKERASDKGTVDRILVRIKDPNRATQISRAIDQLFANSAAPTRTGSEKSDRQSNGLAAIGDVGFFTRAVITAVLFMLLFLTGNTMMQSVRERIPEFGVLKTLGYSDHSVLALVLSEAVVLCGLAGIAGLGIAKIGMPLIGEISPDMGQLLLMPWSALFAGLALALAVALISGFIPALKALRLNIIDALRT